MKTIKEKRSATLEVDKSKFIAIAVPLSDVDSFKTLHKELKNEHPKAKHIVYAYRVGNSSKSCDDQEPRGTAGHPILEFMFKKELNNLVIFVVRYFGGKKLGAGKLLRTYLQSAINVINDCELEDI